MNIATGTILCGAFLFLTVGAAMSDDKPADDGAKKDGLSLTVTLPKKVFRPNDEIKLTFRLKNESKRELYVGDGWLGPEYHETGPGRHFELHVTADRDRPLRFWSGQMTEGRTSGIRKVFPLAPAKEYAGWIRLSAGADKDRNFASLDHPDRGGSFEEIETKKAHRLGTDARKYSLVLRYQIRPDSHGVWDPPVGFKETALWKGQLDSAPIEFEIAAE